MKLKIVIISIFSLLSIIPLHASEKIDSIAYKVHEYIQDTLPEHIIQRTHIKDGWVKQLIKNRFDVMDTTLQCPKFVDFCFNVYRWGDRTFNSYDTAYVYSIPKKWKVMLKVNSKWDMYHVNAHDDKFSLFVNSEPRTSAGFRISFMAVGFEYTPDIDNLLSGKIIDHRRTRINFTCSRLFAEIYYNKNTGMSRINKFGNYNDGKIINLKYDGLTSKTLGVDLFYFFNNKKYAHAAAYCFSKIQKRSAGSFILGLQYSNQKLDMDMSKIPEELKDINPWPDRTFRMHYYDYAINVGYAYNWVFHHNWVFNVMAVPSLGLKHGSVDTIDGINNRLALNIRARMALVRNCGNFFYGFHASFNGYTSWSKSYWLYNQIGDATASAGFRF